MKLYSQAAAVSNITVSEHKVTYDPGASWLKFHLGINRYALYSRDDPIIPKVLQEMQSMTIVSAGDGQTDGVYACPCHVLDLICEEGLLQITLKMRKPWKENAIALKVGFSVCLEGLQLLL